MNVENATVEGTTRVNQTLNNDSEVWAPFLVAEEPKNEKVKNHLPCFRAITPIFPKSDQANPTKIPLGLIISPGDFHGKVPVADYTTRILPYCTCCGASVNVYCSPHQGSETQLNCPICGSLISISKNLKFHEREEFKTPVYDIIVKPPQTSEQIEAEKKQNKKDQRQNLIPQMNFVCLIDVSERAIKSGFTKRFVSTIIEQINRAHPDAKFVIFTYAESIVFYDQNKKREFVFTDLKEITFPTLNINKIQNNREFVLSSLEQIKELKAGDGYQNCFGCVMKLAEKVLEGSSGVILANITGTPSAGPVQLHKASPPSDDCEAVHYHQSIPNSFYLANGRKFNLAGISLHLIASTDGFENMNVVSLVSGISSGTFEEIKEYEDEKESDRMRVEAFVQKVIATPYFYRATGSLSMTPGIIHVDNVFSNGTYQDFNAIHFGNLPMSSTIVYQLSSYKEMKRDSVGFQFRYKYIAPDGSHRIRVMTQWFPASDDPEEVRASVDVGAYALYLARYFVNNLLTYSFKESLNILKGNGDELIESVLDIMRKNSCFSAKHDKGPDGRISDIIMIRNFNVIDFLLFLVPRQRYIGPDNACLAEQDYYTTRFTVKKDCDKQWLKNAFGVDSIDQLPSILPYTNTPENKELFDFLIRNNHMTRIYIKSE